MNRNNLFSFNPRPYQKHLSPFGQKVLNVLMNKWKKDRQSRAAPPSNHHYVTPSHHRVQHHSGLGSSRTGVLHLHSSPNFNTDVNTFEGNFLKIHENENVINDIIEPPKICEEDDNSNRINTYPPVPTSVELVTTLGDEIAEERHNLRTEDLINSVSLHNNYFKIPQNIEFPKTQPIEEGEPFFDFNVIDGLNSNTRKVGWDNMFDTELLDTALPVVEDVDTESNERNLFEINFPNGSTTSTTNSKDIKSKKVTKKQKKDVETKPTTKRKVQSTVTDKIPKKVKKVVSDSDKIAKSSSFRKEKYTTTVKNWLDTVDPNNDIDEESRSSTLAILENIDRGNFKKNNPKSEVVEHKKSEIQIETKPKQKLVKKVVQAKLANKCGKMKFGKPTEAASTSPADKPEPTATETKAKVTDKIEPKEKKAKPKFVAPIKSQIPVKDVSYDVVAVDDTDANIELCKSRLLSLYDCDIILLLIYSNGFCQLNNHHTEDTSVPEGVMVNVDDTFYYLKGNNDEFPSILTHVLKSGRIICYEGKKILMYLATQFNIEIDFELNIIDTKIGGSLLDPDNPPENFSELQKLLSSSATFTIATECRLQKSAWYVTLLRESSAKLMGLLKVEQLWMVFQDIEMKLVPIIADMESQGIIVDMEKLKSMETLLVKKMKQVEEECYKAAGKVFQITSSAQVRALLYEELRLDARCQLTVRGTQAKGAKSTSEHMLRTLGSVHPLPALVVQYRQLHKSYSTFIAGVAHHEHNGVVKPTWVQNAAATGRIACNNPNLQAIPKAPFNLGTISEDEEEHILHFRSVYLPPAGRVFLAADFQQVECRVWAHAAGDRAMTAAIQNNDLFTALAADWLGKPESSVCSVDRERTKRLVYASLYGAGHRKLADILQLSQSQTNHLIDTFYSKFPSLKSFSSEVVSRCAAEGRLVSTGGRRRLLPHITAEDEGARKHAERQAVNFIVQGSAADVCKSAMVVCVGALRARRCPARLALMIHDELVFTVAEEHLRDAAVIIKQAMERCGFRCGLPLRLPVSLAVGRHWADMTPYQLQTSD